MNTNTNTKRAAEAAQLRASARNLSDAQLRAICDETDRRAAFSRGLSDWELACYDVANERWQRDGVVIANDAAGQF